MKRNRKLLLSLTGTLLLVFLLLSLRHTMVSSQLPRQYFSSEVAGLELEREFLADEAFEMAKKSHLGKLEAPQDSAIGYYQEGLTIWVAKYDSKKIAARETKRMANAIEKFAGGFESPTKLSVDGYIIYRTRYRGTFHYFWANKDFLLYVQSGPLSDSDTTMLIRDMNNRL